MTRSLSSVDQEFRRLLDSHRHELLAHCYRMLGSVHEAEDLVQETYLNAWRGYSKFEGRSSVRTWLYRIATNACLNALEGRDRRPLPIGLGTAGSDPDLPPVEQAEVPWLEPIPDTMLGADIADPAAVVTSRESVRLAFIAALQYLPPRQRAVLVLRDVLKWRAAEVADLLQTTPAAVNSALQRARAQLEEAAPNRDDIVEPTAAQQRELLDRYVAAFEAKNIPAIVGLFTEDAIAEMPPFPGWYQGPGNIGRLVANWCPAGARDLRMIPINGNGQPGFATYMRATALANDALTDRPGSDPALADRALAEWAPADRVISDRSIANRAGDRAPTDPATTTHAADDRAVGDSALSSAPGEGATPPVIARNPASGPPASALADRPQPETAPPAEVFVPWKLELLVLDAAGVRHTTSFFDIRLFETFGLPAHLIW